MGQDTRDWGDLIPEEPKGVPFEIKPVEGNRQPVRRIQMEPLQVVDSGEDDPMDRVEAFGPDPYVHDEDKREPADEDKTGPEWEAFNAGQKYMDEAVSREVQKDREQRAAKQDRREALQILTDVILDGLRWYAESTGKTAHADWLIPIVELSARVVEEEQMYLQMAEDYEAKVGK